MPGADACIFEIEGTKVGLIICEDAWHASAAAQAKHHGAQLLVIPNASPYHLEKQSLREDVAKARVLETGLPLIYLNAVGGQDELVFDGASFALSKTAQLALAMPHFQEGLAFIEYKNSDLVKGEIASPSSIEAQEIGRAHV